ncbi:MAG: Gfo/Idh/MocA family protein [Thermomicrobiales bacterium]
MFNRQGADQPRQVALVGAAHIHTPNFIKRLQARRDVRAVAVWDHDAARARRNAEALGAEVRDLDAIWGDGALAGVIICAETDRHEPLVLAATAAGKHLFVEKPLGIGAADAERMADAIERAGVLFQTGYFMRGHAINLFLREQIARGVFGTITRVRAANCHAGALKGLFDTDWRWLAEPQVAGFGGFGDLGTHALDLALWLFGDAPRIEAVTASIHTATHRYGDCDEYGEGLLIGADGLVVSLAAGWVDTSNPVTLEISGTAGHATVFNGDLYLECAALGADGKQPWRKLPDMLPHAFDLFLDALAGKPNVPLVSAREAARRSALMEALYTAARERRWVEVGQSGSRADGQ